MKASFFRVGAIVGIGMFIIATSAFAVDLTIIDHKKGDGYGQMFGDACEGLGDINGDGYNDFLTTSRTDQELYLYLGAPHPFDNPPIITWPNHNYDIFSFSPVNIGDIDCDGMDDILISGRQNTGDVDDQGWLFIMSGWDGDPVTADNEAPAIPDDFVLSQNYPNPFNSGTAIEFNISRGGYTELEIFNILGELIATPLRRYLAAGEHRVNWDGRNASGNPTPTGIYFYRVTSGEFTETKKMILVK
jgi:hypothetical protein